MFAIVKSIVWIAGILVVAYFVLGYFGYEFNLGYFTDSKKACQENIQQCTSNLIHQGVDNVQCDITCVDPELIIKKK
jgi:hypothetical protein